MPDQAALDALNAIPLKKASTDRVLQVTNGRGACPPQAGDTPGFNIQPESMPTEGPTARPFFTKPGITKDLQICYYALDKNHNGIKPLGSLEASTSLAGAEAASVYDGLMAAPVAKSCTAASSTFAVVFTDDVLHGESAVVELDGCRRAATNLGSIREPSQTVIDDLITARPA